MESLQKSRDGFFEQFLLSTTYTGLDDDIAQDTEIVNNSLYSFVERRVFPEKQALSAEELQRLLEADLLAKMTQQTEEGGDKDSNHK